MELHTDKFFRRTSSPSLTNKYYIRKGKKYKGITGVCKGVEINSKTHSCLPNCVGMVLGYIAEYQSEMAGEFMQCSINSMNAKNFWANAPKKKNGSWIQSQVPQLGAIACYGATSSGKYGKYGHVATVIGITGTTITVIASDAGGKRFYVKTLKYPYKWKGCGSFQGFLLNPNMKEEVKYPEAVERNEKRHQVEVIATKLRMRKEPSLDGEIWNKYAPVGYLNVLEQKIVDGYTWDKVLANSSGEFWIATKEGKWTKDLPIETDKQKIARLEKELDEANSKLKATSEELDEANTKITDLETELEKAETKIEDAKEALA